MEKDTHWTDEFDAEGDQLIKDLRSFQTALDKRMKTLETNYSTITQDLRESHSVETVIQLEGIVREYVELSKQLRALAKATTTISLITNKDYWNAVSFQEVTERDIELNSTFNAGDLAETSDETRQDMRFLGEHIEDAVDTMVLDEFKGSQPSDEAGEAMSEIIDQISQGEDPPELSDIVKKHGDTPEEVDVDLEEVLNTIPDN